MIYDIRHLTLYEYGSTVAVSLAYLLLRQQDAVGCVPFDDAVRHAEDVYLNQLMATEDAEEGLRAIMAKRKPQWKDR